MSHRTVILAVAAILSLPAAAQDFSTELTIGFGYLGGKVDEPVVAADGTASNRFAFREDSSGRSLSIAATRYFGGVPDDGATPLALLPFVARRSSLSAGVTLSARSRDSYGISRGEETTIESRFTADASESAGVLDGALFVRPDLAVHATFSSDSFRETQAYSAVFEPSGASQLGSRSPKIDRYLGSLGVLARPTPEIALEVAGFGETATAKATQVDLFGRVADLRSDGDTLGVSLSGRLLLLGRSLALDAGASYARTHGDDAYTEPVSEPLDVTHAIARTVTGSATFFPLRTLGLTAGADYSTSGITSAGSTIGGGPSPERRVEAIREVVWRAGVRFFPRPGASVSLTLSRTTTDMVTPPDSPSFTRLRATDDRATFEAALRF